ncbi:MAG: hypothetical protein AAFU34_18790 [Pseudomonadota bacterium]
MLNNTLIAVLAVGLVAGCAEPRQSARADLLDRPINCEVADIDIAALETAIPGAAERAAAGVRLIVPAARIAGRVRGQLDERREIASGRTEDELRARIAEIKAACPDASASNAAAGD